MISARRIGLLLSCALLLSACGTLKGGRGGLFGSRSENGLLGASASAGRSTASASDDNPGSLAGVEINGQRLRNTEFDIPVVYNDEVAYWVDYFTGVGRRHFAVYMERKARMEPVIVPRLRAANMPEDLIYLAMIESGFSTAAKSHAGAVGPWQFIKSTGRLFGLQSDWWHDERRDPIKSTEAAIAYLGRLHAEFGDWSLACAAYNSGELRIRRGIASLNTRDFWTIARHRRALRRETKDYVPKMMAAAIIGKNAEQFGFRNFAPDNSLVEYAEVRLPRAENLRTVARLAGVSRDDLLELNPELMRCCTPPQRGSYTLRVPKGEGARLIAQAIEDGEIGRFNGFQRHVIRRGDTLSRIAARAGVPTDAILAMNDIRSVRALKPGTELVIPDRGSRSGRVESRVIASTSSKSSGRGRIVSQPRPSKQFAVTHVVKRGDTLYKISRRYAVRIDEIRRWNSISGGKNLRPGSRIKLYVRNEERI